MSEDRQLLAEFCRNGSETAFRRLVERHLKMVYSTAMRVVNGDVHLAQDIAQSVFSNLARKARYIPAQVVLAGWLHRDARFTALEFLRKERRRIAREREAAIMYELESSGHEAAWSCLRPILDEVLDELEEEDRHALLLRFFGQQNLAEVGAALGLTEDTARKRVSRALEKLRQLLSSRSITTTTAALSLVLTTRGVEVIPAGLASQFVHSALAAAGTTTTSTVGILALITSMKITTLITASTVLLFLGAAIVKFHTSGAVRKQMTTTSATEPINARDANVLRTRRSLQARSEANTANDAALVSALAQIEEVLNDPKPTRSFPNPAMQKALAALGEHRAAALPLLGKALQNLDERVSNRAVDGLSQIGHEAQEMIPSLMQKLRDSGAGAAPDLLVLALQNIGPSAELVSELVQTLKDNPAARLAIANSISTPVWGDVAKIDEALRPLLQDKDIGVNQAAAYSLAMLLGSRAGDEVTRATIEGLKSADEDLRSLALSALKNIGSDPKDPSGRVTPNSFGPAGAEAVSALIDIANNNNRKDQQILALQLLDAIQPGLRQENSTMDSMLQTREQDSAFATKVRLGEVSLPELIEGAQQHPGAIGAIANALAAMGPDAQSALPALRVALTALEPRAGASPMDLAQANRSRDALVDAMQKIAPDQPKPLFTESDVRSVLATIDAPSVMADRNLKKRLAVALSPVLADFNGRAIELTPEQMHQLLDALKTVDQPVYDIVSAKVNNIDPQFYKKPKP
ncbi:MAG TPA: sigma-70 family RNA polymerase sigma factor [Verrucomicrobiae bacterium]|nr:sigma-70 family RNA polymerase sigma factor [Verrucomicrobiae bacterium]